MTEYRLRRLMIFGGPPVVGAVLFFALGTDVPGRFTGHDLVALLFAGAFVTYALIEEYMVERGRWKR